MKTSWLFIIAGVVGAAFAFAQPPPTAPTPVPPPAFFLHSLVDAAGPRSIWGKCAADLNGDGRPDLLAGGARGGGLVWYENPGWTKHLIDTASNISTDIEVVDIDGSGKPDVVAITWAPSSIV
jgi:hypothetical protein